MGGAYRFIIAGSIPIAALSIRSGTVTELVAQLATAIKAFPFLT
jgi:hypothetical protein